MGTVSTIGEATLAQGEETAGTSGSPDVWMRALADARSKAQYIAGAMGRVLGDILDVVELDPVGLGEEVSRVVVRVTYALQVAGDVHLPSTVEARPRDADSSILDFVSEEFRPLYARFRSRLLEENPLVRAVAAPLRKGTRRYEGFRVDSRNVVYAGFRAKGIRLMFELPKGHGLPQGEYVTRGRRDWRVLVLSSPNQLDGALLLARDAIQAFEK